MTTTTAMRGIRNNNPGNIDYNKKTAWQGLANPPIEPKPAGGGKARFARFKTPAYGIRAIARTLITYQDQHDIDTVFKLASRWAPPSENNTQAYAKALAADVSRFIGKKITIHDKIDLHEYQYMRPIVCGVIEHENALVSYLEAYTDDVIDKGLLMAGIEPPKKPLTQSKIIQGAQISGAGTVGISATEFLPQITEAQESLSPLMDYSDWIKAICIGLILLGIAITVWSRWKQRQKGLD